MKESAQILNNNALHLIEKGELEGATEFLKRAATIDPDNPLIWFNLGVTLRDAGNLLEARQALERAHEIDGDDEQISDTLAIVCMNLGDTESALALCAEGLERNELNPRVWNTFGVLYFNRNELDLAAEAFEHAVTIDPYYYDALFNLRDTYEETGNEAGMQRCIEQMKLIRSGWRNA